MKLSRSHLAGIAVIAGLFLFGIGIPFYREQYAGVCSTEYVVGGELRPYALRAVLNHIGSIELGSDNTSSMLHEPLINMIVVEEGTIGSSHRMLYYPEWIASYIYEVNEERVTVSCRTFCRCEITDWDYS